MRKAPATRKPGAGGARKKVGMSLFPVGHASHSDWRAAADAVLQQLRLQMAGPGHAQRPRLGLVYLSHAHAAHARPLLQHLARALPHVADWAGCSAGGVLAMSHEYLSGTALAVMLLDVPAAHYRLYSGLAPLHAPGGEAGFTAHSALVHAAGGQPELAELLYELSERTESGLLFGGVGDDGEDGVEGVQIACRTEDLHAQHADARGIFVAAFQAWPSVPACPASRAWPRAACRWARGWRSPRRAAPWSPGSMAIRPCSACCNCWAWSWKAATGSPR